MEEIVITETEVKQDLVLVLKNEDGVIVNNATELKNLLSKGNKYKYVVDENNCEQATKDRASLNDLEKNLTQERIAFEKKYNEAWLPVKQDLMMCEKMIKALSTELSTGIKTIDDVKKNEKKEEIKQAFQEIDFTVLGYEPIDFELVWDSKWANASTSKKKWQDELQVKINKIIQDFKMLNLFLPENEIEKEQVKQIYVDTLDLGLAKCKADELLKLHEKVEQKKQEAPVEQAQEEQAPVIASDAPFSEPVEETLYTRAFQVVNCTKQQIIDLGNYMNANGIKFEKVEI